MSRIIILTEGKSNPNDAKTATGVLRYRTDEVVAVLDGKLVGRTAGEVLGTGGDTPFVASVADVEADALLLGIAPAGGRLPEEWRSVIRQALERGMDILNGLHLFLGDDPELRALAEAHGARLVDLRRPPRDLTVSQNKARTLDAFRVHTVGHDCSVGKMVTSLEIDRALRQRGHTSEFVATGQTGIVIAGKGIAVDAVVSDFISGAVERMVLDAADREFILIEGQGSLVHPMYSGVTLGLLHGCAPQAMVMVCDPTRKEVKHSGMAMPPLPEIIEHFERMASIILPSRVVAVAVNTWALDDSAAREAVDRLGRETGLPTTDVIRFEIDPVIDAILAAREAWLREGGAKA